MLFIFQGISGDANAPTTKSMVSSVNTFGLWNLAYRVGDINSLVSQSSGRSALLGLSGVLRIFVLKIAVKLA
jgi:hypothetical protein